MTASGRISYYCFNKACKGSVYFTDSIRIKDVPFTAYNIAHEQTCSICHAKMVSAMDIELKKMLNKKRVAGALAEAIEV
jgi:hypothetical protein